MESVNTIRLSIQNRLESGMSDNIHAVAPKVRLSVPNKIKFHFGCQTHFRILLHAEFLLKDISLNILNAFTR